MTASYNESPSASSASPQITIRPACAMNAEKLPTLPPTTISAPLSEIPQRNEASTSMISKPPWAEPHAAGHHVFGGSRTGVAMHRDRGMLVHARHVVADVAVNLHVELGIETACNGMRPIG